MKIYIVLVDPDNKPASIHSICMSRADAEIEVDTAQCEDEGLAFIYEYQLDFSNVIAIMRGCNKIE